MLKNNLFWLNVLPSRPTWIEVLPLWLHREGVTAPRLWVTPILLAETEGAALMISELPSGSFSPYLEE